MKCVVWGTGKDYNKYIKYVKYEEVIGGGGKSSRSRLRRGLCVCRTGRISADFQEAIAVL